MRKRIFMLLALALMLVAAMALSGVAQAASPRAECKQEVTNLGLIPGDYHFIYGNNKKDDNFTGKGTAGVADVFCGLGGSDSIDTLAEGDIFIGGAGNDQVIYNYGTFNGGAGYDYIGRNNYGTFNGGADGDQVVENYGTFNGDAGNDSVYYNYGTFNGGDGDDSVYYPEFSTGTFVQ